MDEHAAQPDPDSGPSGPVGGPAGRPGGSSSVEPDSRSVIAAAVEFLTLGASVAVTVVAGGAAGYGLDRWLGTSPLFVLIGVVVGLAAAVLMTRARVRKYL
jgi:ATP synthase protein I